MEATTPQLKQRLSYPTNQKQDVLEALAEYEVLTVRDLAEIIYGATDKVTLSSVVRTTKTLEGHHLINRIFFQPDEYLKKRGILPYACGLSAKGVQWAHDNLPLSDPKEFADHLSPLMLPHTLKRTHFHVKLAEYCDKNSLKLFWKKIDLYHTVEPDDLFAIEKDGKRTYYFLELERQRKTHKKLLAKYKRYESYYGTDKCKTEWFDFKTFTVVTQMRSDASRQNTLRFLAGEPATYNGKRIVNDSPIRRSNFWFSTEQDPFAFLTPKDRDTKAYTFLDN